MESLLFLLPLLICPVGMLVIGGIAWLAAKVRRDRSATSSSPQEG